MAPASRKKRRKIQRLGDKIKPSKTANPECLIPSQYEQNEEQAFENVTSKLENQRYLQEEDEYCKKKKRSSTFAVCDKSASMKVKWGLLPRVLSRSRMTIHTQHKERKDCSSDSSVQGSSSGGCLRPDTVRCQFLRKVIAKCKSPSRKMIANQEKKEPGISLLGTTAEGGLLLGSRGGSPLSKDTEGSLLFDDQDSTSTKATTTTSEHSRSSPKIEWDCQDAVHLNLKTIDACVTCMLVSQSAPTNDELVPSSDYSQSTFLEFESMEHSASAFREDRSECQETDKSSLRRNGRAIIYTQSILDEDDSCASSLFDTATIIQGVDVSVNCDNGDGSLRKEDDQYYYECNNNDDDDAKGQILSGITLSFSLENRPGIEMKFDDTIYNTNKNHHHHW